MHAPRYQWTMPKEAQWYGRVRIICTGWVMARYLDLVNFNPHDYDK